MFWHWIIFILILFLIPIGIAGFKLFAYKHIDFTPTEEQKKIANQNMAKYMLFYWLCDIFYLTCFNNWLIMKFIIGILLMIIVFYSLTVSFLSSTPKNFILKFGFIQDFIVGIGLSIYLIYIIPCNEIKEIVIPIVSALYGGLLTLVGVAWTIRHTENNRKKDDAIKAKPYFSYNMILSIPKVNLQYQKICMSDCSNQTFYFNDVSVEIENSNLSTFEMKKIYHDGIWEIMEGNTIFLPNTKTLLNFRFSEKPHCLFIEIEDYLLNKYYYQLFILPVCEIDDNKYFNTVREIKMISKENLAEIIRENK